MAMHSAVFNEVIRTQTRMAERVAEVIKKYQDREADGKGSKIVTSAEVAKQLLIKYENVVNDMIILAEEVGAPKPNSQPGMPPMPITTEEILMFTKKLNKGYIKFVDDTSEEKITALFHEALVNDSIENELGLTTAEGTTDVTAEGLVKPEGI